MTCAATAALYDELCNKLRKISHLEGLAFKVWGGGAMVFEFSLLVCNVFIL